MANVRMRENWMRVHAVRLCATLILASGAAMGQTSSSQLAPDQTAQPASAASPSGLKARPQRTPAEEAEALRISKLPLVNGRPYDQPSDIDKFMDYVNDTYEIPGITRSTVRALYAQYQGGPKDWGQDWTGFGKREGSSLGTTAISESVKLGMELVFHEDLRYIPCRGCSVKKKIGNAFLAEITARHDETGRRFFTLTPTVADFSGPIIAHSTWYPGSSRGPESGFVSARTYFATRIGSHLFEEFVWEKIHKEKKTDK
jgi:hypothetical protein